MNPHLNLATRCFSSRIAPLGFSVALPADWTSQAWPDDEVNFGNPARFEALAMVSAPSAPMVFTLAARPAHAEGALFDWVWFHLNQQALQPRAVGRDLIAGVTAISGEATQGSDLGPRVVHFAFLEDGDRLLNLSLSAPEALADAAREAWLAILKTFSLASPRGSRFGLQAPSARASVSASAPASMPTRPAPSPKRRFRMFDFALSDDSTALDDDHAINRQLRQQGDGSVPGIASLNDSTRTATLAAGAVQSRVEVPYGWHVVDDGRRTLVFEPGGQVQIELRLLPRRGRSDKALLDEVERALRHQQADSSFERPSGRRFAALQVRGLHGGGAQTLEQVHLLRPFRDDNQVLRARVTTTPAKAAIAHQLAELILASCRFETAARPQQREAAPAAA